MSARQRWFVAERRKRRGNEIVPIPGAKVGTRVRVTSTRPTGALKVK